MPLVFNPTDSPVTVDGDRLLAGRSWGEVKVTDERVVAALEAGRLVRSDAEPPEDSPYRESWEAAGGRPSSSSDKSSDSEES